jgi:hypothetical protein
MIIEKIQGILEEVAKEKEEYERKQQAMKKT